MIRSVEDFSKFLDTKGIELSDDHVKQLYDLITPFGAVEKTKTEFLNGMMITLEYILGNGLDI